MEIVIDPDDWGVAPIQDIAMLLANVANQFFPHLDPQPTGRIRVQCRPNEQWPRTLYRNSITDDYIIWLTVQNTFWSQYSYQFAHEFCHVLSRYEMLRQIPNQWFHETLCETASLFALKRMAASWPTAAPYENWRGYAPSLDNYADNIINRTERQLPNCMTLGEWFQRYEVALRADPIQRELNGVVANKMLPLFLESPHRWQALRYMPDTAEPFRAFIDLWGGGCPDQNREVVASIRQMFWPDTVSL